VTRLIAIVGPTASGKSDLAAELAHRLGGEVVNADSRQFYRGMNVGTAGPSADQLALAPHHLVGFLEPTQSFSLTGFLELARSLVKEIDSSGRLPILSGGTGQYVWGLLEGWDVPKAPPDPAVRSRLESELRDKGVGCLAARLQAMDPVVAARTDLRNHRRVVRALERLEAGADIGAQPRKAETPPYDALVIGLRVERAELHARIRARIDHMISQGWRDEVARLLDAGVPIDAPALSAIGYREMARYLAGELTLDQVKREATVATNRLVRHQNNWFKPDDPRIRWIDIGDHALNAAESIVREWLASGAPSP
jgi:tRNA dimethylallyltransferase